MNVWIYFSIAIAIYPLLFWWWAEDLENGDPFAGAAFLFAPLVWPLSLAITLVVLGVAWFLAMLQVLARKVARYKRSRRGSL